MTWPDEPFILCVPNLQGERLKFALESAPMHWTTPKRTLDEQVQVLKRDYNDHHVIIGSSFGALAAWKFTSEHRPGALKRQVLLDVLPSLDLFPAWRKLGLMLIPRFPKKGMRLLYQAYHMATGHSGTVDLHEVVMRLASLETSFPRVDFPIPTLVLSAKSTFHRQWCALSNTHSNLDVEKLIEPAQQIDAWLKARPIQA